MARTGVPQGQLPLPSTTPSRDSSPELGSPSKTTQFNKSTGRPIRKSAGKAKKAAGYVDSTIIEEEEDLVPVSSDEEDDEEDEEEDEEEDDDMEQLPGRNSKSKAKAKAKRKRSPSPPPPHLAPIIYDQLLDDDLTDDETGGAFHRHTPKKPPMTLQFNVPLGFHGPLFVKLDSALLKSVGELGEPHTMQQGQTKKARTEGSAPSQSVGQQSCKGFNDLPPEIRNAIYRHTFAGKRTNFTLPVEPHGRGLCQSAQFLRTCRLVHQEGCSILYGENTFQFGRNHSVRSPFWEPVLKEIGYQDVLQFLRMIGPENIQYLRDIVINLDDAAPRHTAYLVSNEERRYLNDEYLIDCLRILREAKLRRVRLHFLGRRNIYKSDVKFLGYLEQVKADEVSKFTDPYDKISYSVWRDVQESMTRKKRLYEKAQS